MDILSTADALCATVRLLRSVKPSRSVARDPTVSLAEATEELKRSRFFVECKALHVALQAQINYTIRELESGRVVNYDWMETDLLFASARFRKEFSIVTTMTDFKNYVAAGGAVDDLFK